MNSDNQQVFQCGDLEYMTWIHTILWDFILEYIFNYMSSYTVIEVLWYVQLYEYL